MFRRSSTSFSIGWREARYRRCRRELTPYDHACCVDTWPPAVLAGGVATLPRRQQYLRNHRTRRSEWPRHGGYRHPHQAVKNLDVRCGLSYRLGRRLVPRVEPHGFPALAAAWAILEKLEGGELDTEAE